MNSYFKCYFNIRYYLSGYNSLNNIFKTLKFHKFKVYSFNILTSFDDLALNTILLN